MTRGIGSRLLLARAVGAVALAALATACSSGGSSNDPTAQASCPDLSAVTCPATPPSYKTDVQPILENRCYGCHGPGGVEVSSINLTDYDDVLRLRGDIVSQVTSCKMPPPDAGQPTVDERTTVDEWIECNAPNN
jgi:uncharacterized membrane protein